LIERGSESAISDSAVAVSMLGSAIRGGRLNVEINLKYVKDETFIDSHTDRLADIKYNVDKLTGETTDFIKEKFE
jgi:formiminotetrahydrofolate cyclodeaminase